MVEAPPKGLGELDPKPLEAGAAPEDPPAVENNELVLAALDEEAGEGEGETPRGA